MVLMLNRLYLVSYYKIISIEILRYIRMIDIYLGRLVHMINNNGNERYPLILLVD